MQARPLLLGMVVVVFPDIFLKNQNTISENLLQKLMQVMQARPLLISPNCHEQNDKCLKITLLDLEF